MGFVIKNSRGIPLFGFNNRVFDSDGFRERTMKGTVVCDFGKVPLMPGIYFLDLYFGEQCNIGQDLDIIYDAISFEVLPSDVLGTGKLPPEMAGSIFWPAKWTLEE